MQKAKKGFTLVELVIVIAVIAILAAVLIPTISSVVGSAHKSAVEQEANSVYEQIIGISKTDFQDYVLRMLRKHMGEDFDEGFAEDSDDDTYLDTFSADIEGIEGERWYGVKIDAQSYLSYDDDDVLKKDREALLFSDLISDIQDDIVIGFREKEFIDSDDATDYAIYPFVEYISNGYRVTITNGKTAKDSIEIQKA